MDTPKVKACPHPHTNLKRSFFNVYNTHMKCKWVDEKNELYVKYHDEEWGVPSFDDAYLFEMLILELFQAGLSWITILKKKRGFQKKL